MKTILKTTILAAFLASPIAIAANTTAAATDSPNMPNSAISPRTNQQSTVTSTVTREPANPTVNNSQDTTRSDNSVLAQPSPNQVNPVVNSEREDMSSGDRKFNDKDANNDGRISLEEYVQYQLVEKDSATKDVEDMREDQEETIKDFNDLDENNDGFLTREETKSWFEKMKDKVTN